jgi:hypothetical protein
VEKTAPNQDRPDAMLALIFRAAAAGSAAIPDSVIFL